MSLRERTEQLERQHLSPYASLAAESRGRQRPMEPCQIRTCYQRDVDRIVHSKAFRRLMHKTQVFLQPEGDHYRTRMTHTLEVGPDLPHHCPGPAAQRGPDRGHRPGPRPGPHPLRPRRGAGAQ